jgi:hypothetical protein
MPFGASVTFTLADQCLAACDVPNVQISVEVMLDHDKCLLMHVAFLFAGTCVFRARHIPHHSCGRQHHNGMVPSVSNAHALGR